MINIKTFMGEGTLFNLSDYFNCLIHLTISLLPCYPNLFIIVLVFILFEGMSQKLKYYLNLKPSDFLSTFGQNRLILLSHLFPPFLNVPSTIFYLRKVLLLSYFFFFTLLCS